MKTPRFPVNLRLLTVAFVFAGTLAAEADPRVTSWFTDRSGVYARIYETPADETAQNAVTTWSRGQGTQTLPTYAGIHEISYTNDWVYIRSTGLGSHIMGPWQNGNFPNYPANQAVTFRFPRTPPPVPTPRELTGLGAVGYFVDGVAMFDSRDAFSYDHSTSQDETPMTAQDPLIDGDGIWNRDAYINEGPTFDAGFAHQAGSNYHYHANPPALRHSLGDSVDYNDVTNTYTENFNGNHSPILGWAPDGYPVYGPYGYDDPNNAASQITKLVGGYQPRDGTNGSANLPVAGRTTYPAWATRTYTHTFQSGPAVNATYPLGHYVEDYAYKGDLGLTQGTVVTGTDDFHLDEFNGRFCVTPEFPGGTYAYFTCVDAVGTPVYPYNLARRYYGDPVGGSVAGGAIPAADDPNPVTTVFEGGPEKTDTVESVSVDTLTDDVTLVWSGTEGATYDVNASTDLASTDPWSPIVSGALADFDMLSATETDGYTGNATKFYRVNRINLANFDEAGFDWDGFPAPPPFGGIATITVDIDGDMGQDPPPNLTVLPTSVTFNGVPVDLGTVSRPSRFELTFDVDLTGLAPGVYNIVAIFPGGAGTQLGTFEVRANILFLIADDMGLDASPIDNAEPGAILPNMPTLQSLATNGLRFTRAYVNPACSPTRSSLMTGRYASQTGVYTPQNAGAFGAAETALPEIFTTVGSPYAMASMGKWHLGGGDTGYSARGGWPEFYGITGGGVQDYFSWSKNTNGAAATSTDYTTTDQVDEAVNFIETQEATGTPWFCWVAFNAPHDPFHVPPAGLAPPGGYSTPASGNADFDNYINMMEALDTEMTRLLASVDAARTNIIFLGDNGTPNQVVQAPFGNGHSKGDLYNGGIHVPMVVSGPAVTVTVPDTTNKIVHAVDFFETLLELAGINPAGLAPTEALGQSTSFLPILNGTEPGGTGVRSVIAEGGQADRGRALMMDDHPDYKLIIFSDPENPLSYPRFEFYNITTDFNELSPLDIPSLSGAALTAFNDLVQEDLDQPTDYPGEGVAYGTFPTGVDVLYIHLFDPAGPPPLPQLVNGQGNPIHPSSIVVDGVTATYIARVNPGGSWPPANSSDFDDAADRFWVKCHVPTGSVSLSPTQVDATVTFTIQGNDRIHNEHEVSAGGFGILVKP